MWRSSLLLAAACGHAGSEPRSTATPAGDPGRPARDAEIAARAAPFVDAFSNYGAEITADGHVVFVSTRDGLPQLYVAAIAEPDQPARRLPLPTDRVSAPRLLPDGKTLVFASDVGADQKFHLFRIGIDGSGLRDLTPSGELRRSLPQVARDTGALVYGAHTLEDPSTLVFVQSGDGAPREVYRDPRVGFVSDRPA